jgi:ubiquitin-conjugating enzyme E2 G1
MVRFGCKRIEPRGEPVSLVAQFCAFRLTCRVTRPCLTQRSHHDGVSSYLVSFTIRSADLAKNPIDLVSVGLVDDSNIHEWEILMMGPDGTLFEGGFFKARLVFPNDFPNMPPTMTFTSEMWHPNIYTDGKVCISILHPPGDDEFNTQETADERWRPILGVEQILVSVISMLSDPNDESPANLDAAVMWRNDKLAFKKKVRQIVRKSQEEC